MEAYWLSFYDAGKLLDVTYSIQDAFHLGLWEMQARSCGWWWPYEKICVVSDRPLSIHMEPTMQNNTYRLHNDHGPSINYRDGWQIYSLHGVNVSEEIVMTSANNLNPELLLKERNAEVRREIVRKIGIEQCFNKLGAVLIDEEKNIIGGPYELLVLKLGDGRERPYLKMQNQSTGDWHIEGVPPWVTTVKEALHTRKPTKLQEIPVSMDGEDWVQHGDVCIWPLNASSVKPYPAIIT